MSKSKLQNIKEEDITATWTCPPPETPTKSMEFLARSWSLSAMELSKALSCTDYTVKDAEKLPLSSTSGVDATSFMVQSDAVQHQPSDKPDSPPTSPRGSDDTKELFLLHQALKPDFLSHQQLLGNGLYRNLVRGKTMGRRIKDQKERRKHELRTQNAQLHAAVSVAGVAAAVAALVASSLTSPETQPKATSSKTSAALASAAALVASHCIEIAEDMGADNDQIIAAVSSAINAKTNGDIMTLTAGAATALRGAATLRARLQKGAPTISLLDEQVDEGKDSSALNFVSKGGELLKRTRKGDLHWKEVSFNINSNWQVVAKMKSKHMAGTFTKKKKFVVSAVYYDIAAWPGREREDSNEQRAYFGIKVSERIIEFECRNKGDKLIWIEGIQNMLDCRAHL